ncbi:DUF5694 domain-containing protein, partial [Ornithinibacillus sp. JPR2-1]|uniref:DUF5694 domain-containing protein n=1 Tax=Ornithinibacillus sp. JPR2-1 TaxID=2094019 RepID=UPI0031D0939B
MKAICINVVYISLVFQIGFRIAAASEHKKLHCIDWMEPGVAKRGAGDVYVWAKENQPYLFKNIYEWLESSTDQSSDEYLSILDMYRNCNKETTLKQHHISNINLARIKSAEEYVGMDWLLWWYQRNLIMFSNLADLVTSSDERILLIVGSGHVEILSNFLEESGLFKVVFIADELSRLCVVLSHRMRNIEPPFAVREPLIVQLILNYRVR